MEGTMVNTTSLSTPQGEVDSLMKEVADEARIDMGIALPSGINSTIGSTAGVTESGQHDEDLTQRLAKLRQT